MKKVAAEITTATHLKLSIDLSGAKLAQSICFSIFSILFNFDAIILDA
jgi:hypothetical protein